MSDSFLKSHPTPTPTLTLTLTPPHPHPTLPQFEYAPVTTITFFADDDIETITLTEEKRNEDLDDDVRLFVLGTTIEWCSYNYVCELPQIIQEDKRIVKGRGYGQTCADNSGLTLTLKLTVRSA